MARERHDGFLRVRPDGGRKHTGIDDVQAASAMDAERRIDHSVRPEARMISAINVATGKPIWHTRIGNISNAPETYMLDGHQYVLVATNDMIWAFTLY